MTALVEASDLKVHFSTSGGSETVKAVDGVSFASRPWAAPSSAC